MPYANTRAINDIYGHATGDKVLQQIASAVSASIRQGDLLARYGGDESVLVLADIGAENAQSLLARVVDQLIPPLAGQDPIHIGISYGMSLLAGNDDLGDKLKQADGEMYEAKRAKKSKYLRIP